MSICSLSPSYKGWDIHDTNRGYYLISEVDDYDFMQKPFESVDAAKKYIDSIQPSTEVADPKVLNPLVSHGVIFVLGVAVGAVMAICFI